MQTITHKPITTQHVIAKVRATKCKFFNPDWMRLFRTEVHYANEFSNGFITFIACNDDYDHKGRSVSAMLFKPDGEMEHLTEMIKSFDQAKRVLERTNALILEGNFNNE